MDASHAAIGIGIGLLLIVLLAYLTAWSYKKVPCTKWIPFTVDRFPVYKIVTNGMGDEYYIQSRRVIVFKSKWTPWYQSVYPWNCNWDNLSDAEDALKAANDSVLAQKRIDVTKQDRIIEYLSGDLK